MDSKSNKKKVIVVVSLVLIVLVALTATLFVVFGAVGGKKKNGSPNAENMSNQGMTTSEYFSNYSGNKSIIDQVLSTTKYTGEYEFDRVVSVEFNEDLSAEQIQTIYDNTGGARDKSTFMYNIGQNIRQKKNDLFSIVFESKNKYYTNDYGSFTAKSTNNSYKTVVGKIYGDENLAIVDLNDDLNTDLDNFFIHSKTKSLLYISLNYGSMIDATTVSDSTNTKDNVIYVFEDVYSTTYKYKLYTVAYAYKLRQSNLPAIPDDELNIFK